MIGIISAMELEQRALTEMLVNKKEEMIAGVMYYSGVLEGIDVVICTCGVGKVNAAMHTQILIERYHPEVIIQNGVAGSLSCDVKYFDIVIGSELVYHDMQTFVLESFGPLEKVYYADEKLVALAKEAIQDVNADVNIHVGRIATGDLFVSEPSMKQDIASRTNALCTEMEGCAVAHTSFLNEIPFIVLRSISDMADDSAEVDFEEFQIKAAARAVEIVLALIRKM